MFDIYTTLRPCKNPDEELVKVNPILTSIPPGCELKVFNSTEDLPSYSKFEKYLIGLYVLPDRPIDM